MSILKQTLRSSIVRVLPKFPNNKETVSFLNNKSTAELLIDYGSWVYRYIMPRKRKVFVEPWALSDRRWLANRAEIECLLQKASDGEDLTPYLSMKAHKKGFTPESSKIGPGPNRWADKDFTLYTMGYYHLHLTKAPRRSDLLLFVDIDRETFTVIGLFDHSVFEFNRDAMTMSAERRRLWRIDDARRRRGPTKAGVVLGTVITSSGHPLFLVKAATDYARPIYLIDQKLEDKAYISEIYGVVPKRPENEPRLFWNLSLMRLGLWDKANKIHFCFREGFN